MTLTVHPGHGRRARGGCGFRQSGAQTWQMANTTLGGRVLGCRRAGSTEREALRRWGPKEPWRLTYQIGTNRTQKHLVRRDWLRIQAEGDAPRDVSAAATPSRQTSGRAWVPVVTTRKRDFFFRADS